MGPNFFFNGFFAWLSLLLRWTQQNSRPWYFAWENLQEVFVMLFVVVVVFPHWRILHFRTTFPCHRRFTLASQAREVLHHLWVLPWLLSVALLFPGFSVTVLPRALGFWEGILDPQAFFTLCSFTDILWHVFVTQMRAGTPTPSRMLLCACPHRVVPSSWRMDLNYSYCSYKAIDLSIAPVSHEL